MNDFYFLIQEKFTPLLRPNTAYEIESKFSKNYVWDVKGWINDIISYVRHKGENQQFIANYLGVDVYIISIKYNSSLVVTVPSNSSERNLILSYWNTSIDNKYQQFKLIDSLNDGSFKLQNVGTGLFLENDSITGHIVQSNETDSEMQYFYLNRS